MKITVKMMKPLFNFLKKYYIALISMALAVNGKIKRWYNGPELREAPGFSTWFHEINPPDQAVDIDGTIHKGMSQWAHDLRERRRIESLPRPLNDKT